MVGRKDVHRENYEGNARGKEIPATHNIMPMIENSQKRNQFGAQNVLRHNAEVEFCLMRGVKHTLIRKCSAV